VLGLNALGLITREQISRKQDATKNDKAKPGLIAIVQLAAARNYCSTSADLSADVDKSSRSDLRESISQQGRENEFSRLEEIFRLNLACERQRQSLSMSPAVIDCRAGVLEL
jgi:hypothetical protein